MSLEALPYNDYGYICVLKVTSPQFFTGYSASNVKLSARLSFHPITLVFAIQITQTSFRSSVRHPVARPLFLIRSSNLRVARLAGVAHSPADNPLWLVAARQRPMMVVAHGDATSQACMPQRRARLESNRRDAGGNGASGWIEFGAVSSWISGCEGLEDVLSGAFSIILSVLLSCRRWTVVVSSVSISGKVSRNTRSVKRPDITPWSNPNRRKS